VTVAALILALAAAIVALLALAAVRGYARELDERLAELELELRRRRRD
jgi:hypothetical protein